MLEYLSAPALNVTDANRTISLEEEIMEVVVPDVNINAPVVDVDAGAIEPTVVSEGIIVRICLLRECTIEKFYGRNYACLVLLLTN